jgi:hypothetical protein
MCRLFFSVACLLISSIVFAQKDSMLKKTIEPKQIRIGIDVSRPVLNAFYKDRYAYDASLDYYRGNEKYWVLEGGFGGSNIDYDNLKYSSKNSFLCFGFEKSMVPRLYKNDWDYLFFGMRYGLAFINRSEGSYTTTDNVWGTTTGTVPSNNFTGHWLEINGGIRVEIFKNIFAGYNLRAKFLLNQAPFKELPPAYIAGYGKGEKTTTFDLNFFLLYALRWKK